MRKNNQYEPSSKVRRRRGDVRIEKTCHKDEDDDDGDDGSGEEDKEDSMCVYTEYTASQGETMKWECL